MSSTSSKEVERYLQTVAAVRIGYGLGAFLAPKLILRALDVGRFDDDLRIVNAFLASRDIAIGLHSLLATRYDRQLDAVLLNQACELADSYLISQELRRGRRGAVKWLLAPFNASQHIQWLRAHQLLRRQLATPAEESLDPVRPSDPAPATAGPA